MSDPVWVHYYRGTRKYQNDTTHWEAYCKYCIDAVVADIRNNELNAVACGNLWGARSEEEIKAEVQGSIVLPLCGKINTMWKHLTTCMKWTDDGRKSATMTLQTRTKKTTRRTPPGNLGPSPSRTQQDPSSSPSPPTPSERAALVMRGTDPDSNRPLARFCTQQDVFYAETSPPAKWEHDTQKKFAADLCVLMIVCNTAWWNVEHPYVRAFFSRWMPEAMVPGRKELSGRILDEEAAKVEDKLKARAKGRFATGQCDGWKNVAKASIIASMLNIEYTPFILNTVDISPVHKTAENLLNIVYGEIVYILSLGIRLVAWCTDASGESAKMRRLLREKIPWIVVIDCWAHQINLIVGDIFKSKGAFTKAVDKALRVVKWFNNHSRALGLLRGVMRTRLGAVLALILPIITRWTSHYLCVDRLLDLEKCFALLLVDDTQTIVECAGKKKKAKAEARRVVKIVSDKKFWDDLRLIRKHIQPLAIATNVTQSDYARLDVVLITMFQLYHYYLNPSLDPTIRAAVHRSLEKRWKKQDQLIFILALLLNPYIRASCFATESPFRVFARVWRLVSAAYKRLFNTTEEPNAEFRLAFSHYFTGYGDFSSEAMSLNYHREQAKAANRPVNLIELWREHDTLPSDDASSQTAAGYTVDNLGPAPNGRRGFVQLAMKIFSIVPNSTATERLFSQFGIVHTKLRNRLGREKVRKQVMVRSDVATEYGRPPCARKRKFYTDDDEVLPSHTATTSSGSSTSSSSSPSSSNTTTSSTTRTRTAEEFNLFIENLLEESRAIDEAEEEESGFDVIELGFTPDDLLFPNLFKFPAAGEQLSGSMSAIAEFWQAGEAGWQAEIGFHDAIMNRDDSDDGKSESDGGHDDDGGDDDDTDDDDDDEPESEEDGE